MTTHRPRRETIQSLRLTLQSLEQSTDPDADAQEIAELKRILLTRIADLEAVTALNAQSAAPDSAAPAAALLDAPPPVEVKPEEATKVIDTKPNSPPVAD